MIPSSSNNDDTTNSDSTNDTSDGAPSSSLPTTPPMAIPGTGISPSIQARIRGPTMASSSPPTGSPTSTSSALSSSIGDDNKLDRSQSISSAPAAASTSTTTTTTSSSAASIAAAAATATLFPTGGNLRGAVLYPNWSLKKLTLWTDYFMRWTTVCYVMSPFICRLYQPLCQQLTID
jgi:hypothetical protein